MSEAELHWLHQRLQGGKLTKAEQGQLRFRLPSGLVYDPVGRVVLDPDEAVQEAIRLVFTLFEQTNSANSAVWCAGVDRTGRISYSSTGTPRRANCQAHSDPASPAPIILTRFI